jgi:heme/copper-type cytochrome/quinol oxidase subunit 4
MFRRFVTEHWQASLALALLILAVVGYLLQFLSALHMPRDQAERRAAMALDDDPPPPAEPKPPKSV